MGFGQGSDDICLGGSEVVHFLIMFVIKCTRCGKLGTARGSFDPETNATEIAEESISWSDDPDNVVIICDHDEYKIVEELQPELFGDEVI